MSRAARIVVLILAAAACRGRSFVVPTTSMEPTIKRGEQIRMEPLGEEPLRRGDLVVYRMNGKADELQVKRVVALGGDRVAIQSKRVILNGQPIDEPFVVHVDPDTFEPGAPFPQLPARDQMPERTVKEGYVLLLGDNRDNSVDSRFFGDVPVSDVVGRVPAPK